MPKRSLTILFQDILNEIILEQQGDTLQRNIRVDTFFSNQQVKFMADKNQLKQAFLNIYLNALQASKEGGKITIAAWQEDQDFIHIGVKDTGMGMTKEQQEHVFSEFYKADKFSSDVESSGLGLAICKRIIEKHGGSIWVKSHGPGTGSTFYFTLKTSVQIAKIN